VEGWPLEEQQVLAMELLRSMRRHSRSAHGERRPSLGELQGIANPTGRTFTDGEIDELRFAALKEKYEL
jgi:hypothetical protein